MSDKGLTLIDLFKGSSLEGMGTEIKKHIEANVDESATKNMAWGFAKQEACKQLEEAMRVDLFDLFASAWAKARELKAYADTSKHPLDETAIVHLGKHELVSEHKPVMSVKCGEVELPVLEFKLNLIAHFESAALTIRAGRIHAIAPGFCSAKTELKYHDTKLVSHETPHLNLPGRIELRTPIAIPH